ncbi:hypothetical protein [Rathayibacter sp. VKM Ac-2927]|uniref:hypothetical protein n=1 Tax=Rathayibacter sp. VKM Ac-2927 TaxID=2929478 RepID=UPI001FB44862|nr:hypothetical protein [Rathayibacter sp. VKM Ac-2927]MCJ1688623.1 hypothetical protein [Rathayibacter sp. VKM Ac-2927]
MVDPISTAAIGAAAHVARSASDEGTKVAGGLITRLLGPSADILGANWAEQLRERNMQRLLAKTEKRARKKEESGKNPGIANPRVASQVFESAQYADGEVVAEYLSGVLASSRSATGEGDAGVAWSTVVSRLSSDQLAMHYVIYASARPLVIDQRYSRANDVHQLEVILPLLEMLASLGMVGPNSEPKVERFSDALDGLMREGLLEVGYRYGEVVHTFESELASGRTIVAPLTHAVRVNLSIHGMRLFVWGNGAGELGPTAYLDQAVELQAVDPQEAPTLLDVYTVETATAAPSPAM